MARSVRRCANPRAMAHVMRRCPMSLQKLAKLGVILCGGARLAIRSHCSRVVASHTCLVRMRTRHILCDLAE